MRMIGVRALAVWSLVFVAAFVNGFFRERFLISRMGVHAGHVLSTVILCILILVLTWLTISWIAPPAARSAVAIGDGRVWIFVLITTAAAPWLTGRLRALWP